MMKSDAIARLRERAQAIRGLGATALFLFGSTVRDMARAESDIDLFIDYDRESQFNAFDLIGIKLLLEKELVVNQRIASPENRGQCFERKVQDALTLQPS